MGRYTSLYESNEWKALEKQGRAHLLWVLEGVKKGVHIYSSEYGASRDKLIAIAKKNGLEDFLDDHHGLHKKTPILNIGTKEAIKRLKEQEEKLRGNQYINYIRFGEFLDYPECCIQEASDPCDEKRTNGIKYEKQLLECLDKRGMIPRHLEFNPGFIPCSVDCPNAIYKINLWKKVLILNDRDAAIEMILKKSKIYPFSLLYGSNLSDEQLRLDIRHRIDFEKDKYLEGKDLDVY